MVLIGRSGGAPMSNVPGTFYLRLVNSTGMRVDEDNAVVTANDTEIRVGVHPDLPAGTYTAHWFTTGVDGHSDSGTLTISIADASVTVQPSAAPAAGDDHAAEEAGHGAAAPAHMHVAGEAAHEAETLAHEMDPPRPGAMPELPVSFTVSLLGSNEVPPVSTSARGTARLVFFPNTSILEIHISMQGVNANQLTGVHLHRGAPNANGPHVFDLINAGFTSVGGSSTLSDSAMEDLLAGNLYINVHSIDFPPGLVRGQVLLPPTSTQHATGHVHEDADDHDEEDNH
jgi:hypothetical protein